MRYMDPSKINAPELLDLCPIIIRLKCTPHHPFLRSRFRGTTPAPLKVAERVAWQAWKRLVLTSDVSRLPSSALLPLSPVGPRTVAQCALVPVQVEDWSQPRGLESQDIPRRYHCCPQSENPSVNPSLRSATLRDKLSACRQWSELCVAAHDARCCGFLRSLAEPFEPCCHLVAQSSTYPSIDLCTLPQPGLSRASVSHLLRSPFFCRVVWYRIAYLDKKGEHYYSNHWSLPPSPPPPPLRSFLPFSTPVFPGYRELILLRPVPLSQRVKSRPVKQACLAISRHSQLSPEAQSPSTIFKLGIPPSPRHCFSKPHR